MKPPFFVARWRGAWCFLFVAAKNLHE